jgi:hypothetical protein
MRTIQWKVAITDNEKIATMENAIGLPQDKVESHLLIISLLSEMIKNGLTWKSNGNLMEARYSFEDIDCKIITTKKSFSVIIGLLENLKQKHLDKLNTLFEKTVKGSPKDKDL